MLYTCRIGKVILLNRKSLISKHIRITGLLCINTLYILCTSTESLFLLSMKTIANLPSESLVLVCLSRLGLSLYTYFQFYHWMPQ